MFGFLKKKEVSARSDYFPITTDIHSHILPGLDDGAPDLEASIFLIKGLMKLGIKKSIATPHVIGDMYRNSPDTIFPALQALQNELSAREIDFEVSAAAEYMQDVYFMELLNDKKLILPVKDRMVLTEFSYSSMPSSPEQLSFAIITEGFSPILAHPERYSYYLSDYSQFHRMQELGYLLQVNLLSLTGYYGKAVAKAAAYIIKNDLASFVATDLHHPRHLEELSHPRNLLLFEKLLSHKEWNTAF